MIRNIFIKICICFLPLSFMHSMQNYWYDGNLKGIDALTFELNVDGIDDKAWEKRLTSFIELRLMEHKILFVNHQMPKLVIDISAFDSRIEETSSFLVIFSLYNYSISEENYYQSMADTLLTKKLMTSKVVSKEILGQTSSNRLYKDLEKSINSILTSYIDQWYKDNPIKQF